jgi:hypothetical protein
MPDANHKLFLSYRRADSADLVRQVGDLLQTRGIPVWSDLQIRPGEEFRTAVTAAWRSAGGFVLFLSPGYFDSQFLLMELGAALGSDVPVIPVRLGDEPLPAEVRHLQAIDGRGRTPEQIADAIKQALDHTPAAASA